MTAGMIFIIIIILILTILGIKAALDLQKVIHHIILSYHIISNWFNPSFSMFFLFIPYVQTIVKKASALLDSNASIHRSHRLYYTYLSQSSSSSWGNLSSSSSSSSSSTKKPYSINLNKEASVEHLFGRPMVVMKLGQYIMDVKVSLWLQSIYRLSLLSLSFSIMKLFFFVYTHVIFPI